MFPNLASLAQPWSARKIPRRVFLKRVISGAGSYPLALALLQKFGSATTPLPSVDETRNWGVTALPVKFPGQGATLEGYLAKPAGRGPHPAVILHGPSGLDEAVRDVARDYAKDGFVALAVALWSGLTMGDRARLVRPG